MPVAEKQKVRFGPFEVDLHTGELSKNGTRLKLQPQPIQILAALLEHPGELVTREELQHRLWPNDTFVDFEQGLNTAVKKLRLVLGDEAETPKYIETLPKRGYRFVGEVQQVPQATQAQPIAATPPSEPVSVQTPARPLRRRLRVVGGTALAIIAVFLLSVYHEGTLPPPRIVAARQLTHTRLPKQGFLATDGSRVYFSEQREGTHWVLAQVSTSGGEVSEIPTNFSTDVFPRTVSPSGSELLIVDCCPWRNFWIQPIPSGFARRSPIPVGFIAGEGWTWNGSFLYSDGHQLFRVNADGSQRTRLFAAPSIGFASLSPDGKYVRFNANWSAVSTHAAGAHIDLMQAGIDGSDQHLVFPQMKGQTSLGGWTADGELFYFVRVNDAVTSLWAAREVNPHFSFSRPAPTLLYTGPLELTEPVASRNTKELYVIGADRRGELSIYDDRSSRFVPYLGGISASYVAFSPDRQWIAYVSYPDGALWKSRIDGSDKMQLTFPPMGVLNPRWSPDGKSIAFMDWYRSEHAAIYIVAADGGQPSLLTTGPSEPSDPTWSPDGRSVVHGGSINALKGDIAVIDLRTMVSTKLPGSEQLVSPRWSPDGKYIAALSWEQDRLMLYDVAQKKWRTLLESHGSVGWPAWTHDSKFIYVVVNNKIYRVNIATGKAETVVNLEGIHWTSFAVGVGGWFDLTPDDRIMILRDTGTEEIYALQLEY